MKFKLINGIFILILILFLSACSNSSEDSENNKSDNNKKDTLVIYDWGGSITDAHSEAMFKPFEEKFNVEVIVETPVDYGKFKTSVLNENPAWSIANLGAHQVYIFGEEGLLEEMDFNIITTDGIPKELVNDYGIGAELYSVTISYNSEKYPDGTHPKTWQEFWDTTKFPGKRALWKYPIETLEIALLADGVPPDQLYPLDIDRAFQSLDKLKEQTDIIWWETGAEPPEMLATGSVEFSSSWNAAITTEKDKGTPVDVEYNQALMASEYWVVPKNAKNSDIAMKFIDFATNAEQQASFSNIIDYTAVNQEGIDMLSEERKQRLGQTAEMAEKQILIDSEWWAENIEEVSQRFQEWLLK